MTQHAACGPSSASMWMNCPASITLAAGRTRPSSKYAREGTAAHEIAERILQGDIFLPDKIVVEGEEFVVSVGMCRALNPYIDYVQGLMAQQLSRAYLEKRVLVPATYGMVWGTLDCGVVTASNNIHVVDLKFGRGVRVDADTPQTKFYALGFADMVCVNDPNAVVSMTICQPRGSGPPLDTYTTTLGDLWQWRDLEVIPALDRIRARDTTEVTGSYCRWCVRQTECRAFAGRHQSHAADVFDDLPQP